MDLEESNTLESNFGLCQSLEQVPAKCSTIHNKLSPLKSNFKDSKFALSPSYFMVPRSQNGPSYSKFKKTIKVLTSDASIHANLGNLLTHTIAWTPEHLVITNYY